MVSYKNIPVSRTRVNCARHVLLVNDLLQYVTTKVWTLAEGFEAVRGEVVSAIFNRKKRFDFFVAFEGEEGEQLVILLEFFEPQT